MIRRPPRPPLFPPPPPSRPPVAIGQGLRDPDRPPVLGEPIERDRDTRSGSPETRVEHAGGDRRRRIGQDRKSTRLNSSHLVISYAVFCLKKKKSHYRPRSES